MKTHAHAMDTGKTLCPHLTPCREISTNHSAEGVVAAVKPG